jgi:hypothetical protein
MDASEIKLLKIIAGVIVLACLGFLVSAGYVVVHFLNKWW